MAEHAIERQIAPGVRLGYDNSGDTLDLGSLRQLGEVWLWDLGEEKPIEPVKPNTPKGRDGDPQYELEKAAFQAALEDYKEALSDFKAAKIKYAAWKKRYGGPIEVLFDAPSAQDAQVNDRRAVEEGRQTQLRWQYVSSRTRGHQHLKNGGLPEGMKPGHGQAEQARRIAEGESDLAALRKTDPVFGQTELRG